MNIYNRKLDHINLTVPDLAKAVDFYTNILGFKVVNRFKNGMEFIFITDGNNTYELIENKDLKETVIDHIAYESDDIKKDYEHFEKLGLVTTNLGYLDFLFDNGVYYFFIKGSGNDKIEFIQKKGE